MATRAECLLRHGNKEDNLPPHDPALSPIIPTTTVQHFSQFVFFYSIINNRNIIETIINIKNIKSIMTTTISIHDETKQRLNDYKMGSMTYDDLLTYFMDAITLEELAEEHVRRHRERLQTFQAVSKDDFKKRLRQST